MSRRGRHGRHPHLHQPASHRPARNGAGRPARPAEAAAQPREPLAEQRPLAGPEPVPPARPSPDVAAVPVAPGPVPASYQPASGHQPAGLDEGAPAPVSPAPPASSAAPVERYDPFHGARQARHHVHEAVAAAAAPAGTTGAPDEAEADLRASCTTAQLRRFIKSRPWVPMHELRRRFGIFGSEDEVTPIRVGDRQLFVGLPPAEGRLMAELLGGGDVGYELSLDPGAPVVVGVYPMRPVPRT